MRSTLSTVLAATLVSIFSPLAFADHSLANAMEDQPELKLQVENAIKRKGLVCDLNSSIQMSPTGKAKKTPNTWRQVAFCYEDEEQMKAAAEQLAKGSQADELSTTYGLPVSAILDATYVLMGPNYESVNQRALKLSIR